MRLPSSAILRRAAAMPANSSYGRGGYPRRGRGYSAGSTRPPHPGVGAEFVSGDSHLSAVRAANDSLRRGGGARGPPPQYSQGPQHQQQPYRQGPYQQPPYGYGYGYGHPEQQGPIDGNYGHPQQPYRQGPQQQQPYRQGPYQQPTYGYGYGYGYGCGHPQQPGAIDGAVPYNYGHLQQPGPIYGAVPYNYGHPQQPPLPPGSQQYGYGVPNPSFDGHPRRQPHWHTPGNTGFHPGVRQLAPRVADYRRRWLYAKQRLPHQAERFSVLSYNILADYLAQEHQFLYKGIPKSFLDWNWRKNKLVIEFDLWKPDILCLQEVDRFKDLEKELSEREYSGIWKMRTGNAIDGCAIFWRTTRFQLRYEENIEFNKLGLRDNVAQICVLETVISRTAQTDSHSPDHPQQAKHIVVGNTHVLYNPRRGDIKLGQVRTLLERAYAVSKMWNNAPVILCGDFNSTPKSPLYNFISEQKLNLSGLAKYTISGQQTSASPQGLYTGSNKSRSHPSYNTASSKEGNIALSNGRVLQTDTTTAVENSCPTGKEPALTDASESNNAESSNCGGNTIPCSESTNPDKLLLLSCLEGPGKDCHASDADACANETEGEEGAPGNASEGCAGIIKDESEEEPKVTDVLSAPASVCGEILQSGSSEIVSTTHLLSSDESSGLKDSRDELLTVSEDNPVEKEKVLESMLPGQDNCTTNEMGSCNASSSQSFTCALHQMSNMRLEGENYTKPTHLESPEEPVHQSNGSVSDAPANHCTSGAIDKYSISSGDEPQDSAGAFEDEAIASEVLCTDVNSDPSFFEELTGIKDSLHGEDQLPAISDGSPSSPQMVTSNESYYSYDPYKWTPDEIRTATGKDECTYLEHNLKLRSTYTDVEDIKGTKDANKEPLVTSYNSKFMGTVDYIWASEDLQTVGVLDTFPKEILEQTSGFPTKKWGSDHIALVCELAFKNDTH